MKHLKVMGKIRTLKLKAVMVSELKAWERGVYELHKAGYTNLGIAKEMEASIARVTSALSKFRHLINPVQVCLGNKNEAHTEDMYAGILPKYSCDELQGGELEILNNEPVYKFKFEYEK